MTEKNKWTRCSLRVDRSSPGPSELLTAIAGIKDGCAILQSHTEIWCVKPELVAKQCEINPGGLMSIFAGRAFDESKELRWVVEDGNISLRTIEEKADSKGPYERAVRKYYLYGTWNGKNFQEAVVRRALLEFPLDTTGIEPDDRPYFEIALYAPAPPSQWPNETAEALRVLNRPAVCGHRLLSLKFGRDTQ